jgi:hypothetical protein
MPSMSVNSRLENLERAVGSSAQGVDGAAVRAVLLDLLAKPQDVELLREAAVTEDCGRSVEAYIVAMQTNVD